MDGFWAVEYTQALCPHCRLYWLGLKIVFPNFECADWISLGMYWPIKLTGAETLYGHLYL